MVNDNPELKECLASSGSPDTDILPVIVDLTELTFTIDAEINEFLTADHSKRAVKHFLEIKCREILKEINSDGRLPLKNETGIGPPVRVALIPLFEKILLFHPNACPNETVPDFFLKYQKDTLRDKVSFIVSSSRKHADRCPAVVFLSDYLNSIEKSLTITFYALKYYCDFVSTFQAFNFSNADLEKALHIQFLTLNFNDLEYLFYYQHHLRIRMTGETAPDSQRTLRDAAAFHHIFSASVTAGCYPRLPAISTMIYSWLKEMQMSIPCGLLPNEQAKTFKIPVNLPVSQIALILKTLQGMDVFGSTPVNTVFDSVSKGIKSKKQDTISKGSLSKEYYSVSQVTAARVIDLLNQMAAKIKRGYFPA